MPETPDNIPPAASKMNKVPGSGSDTASKGVAAVQSNDATASQTDATNSAPQPAGDNKRENDRPPEFGGQKGLEPTRYGDWEKNGRCTDF